MTAAFLEGHGYDRQAYVVLRIDVEGAEYLTDILWEAYLAGDNAGKGIWEELLRATTQWHERYDE